MGRILNLKDIVNHGATNTEGLLVNNKIREYSVESNIIVSFDSIDYVTSSFINSAFITLLEERGFEYFKKHVEFSDTNPQINKSINRVFKYALEKKCELV